MEYKPADRMDARAFDPFGVPPEDLFEGLHLSLELVRDDCMGNAGIMADTRVGAGRCFVVGATPRLRDLLEVDCWSRSPPTRASACRKACCSSRIRWRSRGRRR